MTRHSLRLRPQVLPLEDRTTPTCLVYALQDTLYILGDNADNVVGLTAQGSRMTVTCDNARAVTFDGIRQIVTDLGSGDDRITVARTPQLVGVPPTPLAWQLSAGRGDDVVNIDWAPGAADSIWVDLGSGHDVFDARFIPSPNPNIPTPTVPLDVHGGAGNDLLTVGAVGPCFMPGSDTQIALNGDAGDDRIAVTFEGEMNYGRIGLAVQGGAGNDLLAVAVVPPCGMPGSVMTIGVDGGAGADQIGVTWDGEMDYGDVMLYGQLGLDVQGGAGNDLMAVGVVPPCIMPGGDMTIGVDGGAGADQIGVTIDDLMNYGRFGLDVRGGAGNDLLAVGATNPCNMPQSDTLIALNGDAGDDRINVTPTNLVLLEQGRLRIDAYGGAGADLINVELNHGTLRGDLDVTLAGFAGDDRIVFAIQDSPTFSVPFDPPDTISVVMTGGAGNDLIDYATDIPGGDVLCEGNDGDDTISVVAEVDWTKLLIPNPPPGPPPVVHFDVALRGGAGNDRITSRLGIRLPAFPPPLIDFDLVMDGGTGNDMLDATFESDSTQQKVQKVKVAMLGGAGDDLLRLHWTPGIAFDVDAFANGGAGFDFGVFSPGVRHMNVERLG